jgi:FkbM family methyltransferase
MKKYIVKAVKQFLFHLNILGKVKRLKNKRDSFDSYNNNVGKQFYSQFISNGDLVFDIGANIGNRVKTFCDLGCKVVAVEPQEECCNILKSKFLTENVVIENIGIGKETGYLEYFKADDSALTTFSNEYINKVKVNRHEKTIWNKSKKVKIDTIDNLVLKYGLPKFCKIDVEGYEINVLKGISQPLPALSFEYTLPELFNEMINCIHLLMDKGDYVFNYSSQESLQLALDTWVDGFKFISLVKTDDFLNTNWGDIYCQIRD